MTITILFKKKGYTLLETLVVIAILAILASGAIVGLSSYRDTQVLSGETSQILSILHKARSNTLSSKSQSQYGVRLNGDRVILYQGLTFASSTPTNEEHILNSAVRVSSISLLGGGLDIVFDRLTGETSKSGSFTVVLNSDPAKLQTIIIKETGLVSQN